MTAGDSTGEKDRRSGSGSRDSTGGEGAPAPATLAEMDRQRIADLDPDELLSELQIEVGTTARDILRSYSPRAAVIMIQQLERLEPQTRFVTPEEIRKRSPDIDDKAAERQAGIQNRLAAQNARTLRDYLALTISHGEGYPHTRGADRFGGSLGALAQQLAQLEDERPGLLGQLLDVMNRAAVEPESSTLSGSGGEPRLAAEEKLERARQGHEKGPGSSREPGPD